MFKTNEPTLLANIFGTVCSRLNHMRLHAYSSKYTNKYSNAGKCKSKYTVQFITPPPPPHTHTHTHKSLGLHMISVRLFWIDYHSLARSLVRSLARSLVRSLARSFVRSLARSFVRSLTRSLVRSLARSFVRAKLSNTRIKTIRPAVNGFD